MKDLDKSIFKFISTLAMREAVLQQAYKGYKKDFWSKEFIDKFYDEMKDFVLNVLEGKYNNQEEYDKDFYEKTHAVCNIVNEKKQNDNFMFGNAQKYINIMMKFYYIRTCLDENMRAKMK